MVCASCGRAARAGARFCGSCGAALAPRCPACGSECEPDLHFCEACGASLDGPSAARPSEDAAARKVVTIVFADLAGSTALHERLDAEAVRQFMDGYYAAMRGAVEAHGGRVTQVMGDGVKAVFGAPRVAEDDALRAVRAAVEMQRAFRALVEPQAGRIGKTGLRVAVNTGEVVADDATEIIGDPVNVAARLQEQGGDGDVVVGGETQRIVASLVTLERLGSFVLKGRSEAVEAYRVVSLEPPAPARTAAFVGRDEELARLLAVYEAAVAAPATKLAVLLGSPGLGKSRLLDEVARRLGDGVTVLSVHCEASGGATFAPLVAALRALLGLEGAEPPDLSAALERAVPGSDEDRSRIAAGIEALLSGTPLSPEETFYDVRRLLAALASERPVLLSIDDLQWAEPLLLDLVEHLVQWGAEVPLLVLAAARPELRDTRSSMVVPGALAAEVVTLGGLDATAASRLAASVIGADALPAAVAGRVLITSEGNPLFLRELVRMLVNDGVLRREGERWTLAVAVADLDIPPTIQALLAARLERLRPEERVVLERAAVAGRHFSRAAVAELMPGDAGDLGARLESLRRSELIEPDPGWFLGEPALRFHHVLIRDAAYRRVLKGTRAELHERLADWIEAKPGEHDEMLGFHLEQAHQNLRELGTDDEHAHALGARAARHLGAAGRRALARDDLPLAAGLLGRALGALDADDPARADLALDWCEALLTAGEVGPAVHAVDELGRLAVGSERLCAWHTCFAGQLAVLTDPEALRSTASAVAAAADVLAAAGDATGEAKAHAVHATALARLGENGACEAAIDRALAAARRVRDRRRQNAVLAAGPVAVLWGPHPVTRASGRCLDFVRVLRITQGSPSVEAVALRCQALLEALRGRSDAARRMIGAARSMAEELGITHQLLDVDVFAAHIDLLEGNAAAAEPTLRSAYAALREQGLGIDAARAAALLGKALLAQGRTAEAEAISRESEALAGDDLKAAIAWRGVRAEALAARGEAEAAVEIARAAVAIAAATDGLLDHADACVALAAALRAAGLADEAAAEDARALALWEQKGATLLVDRARATTGAVAPGAPAEVPSARARGTQRRIPENAATAFVARLNAVSAARDADALPALFSEEVQVAVLSMGADLDLPAILNWWRLFFADPGASFRLEIFATLGDSLVLCRQTWSGSASASLDFDVGAFEREIFDVYEVDVAGRCVRAEGFDPDRFGDAVARLYARYAELLPEGPERERATATARSVAALHAGDPSAALAPGAEVVDHRRLRMFGHVRGAEALRRALTVFAESAPDRAYRTEDVIATRPDAFVARVSDRGSERTGGGSYEIEFLALPQFGADGRATRFELFDTDSGAEALSRFDALAAEPAPAAVRRRVRENAATAFVARLAAAGAARDLDALPALFSEDVQVAGHATADLDLPALIEWWRLFLADRDSSYRFETLASLGDSLVLCRQWHGGSASAALDFDVGAFERDDVNLYEVDAAGRCVRAEVFPPDELAAAVVRLYERYAELLPEGPEKARAVATARSVAGAVAIPDLERWASALAPDVEVADRRRIGVVGSVQGADAVVEAVRALRELSSDYAVRLDDVVAAHPRVLLARWTQTGTERVGGGSYERPILVLSGHGPAGLIERIEFFDFERTAEALARFDALTAETAPAGVRRRVRENAATRSMRAVEAAVIARDADAFEHLVAEGSVSVNHSTGSELDRAQILRAWGSFLTASDFRFESNVLASLGERLALARNAYTASGVTRSDLDVGPYERSTFVVVEVDAAGRRVRTEHFAEHCLDAAVVRLYERYAELLPEGEARRRAAARARTLSWHREPMNLSGWRGNVAPDVRLVDRRRLGIGAIEGADALLASVRALQELSGEIAFRFDDVLALAPDRLLVLWTNTGTERTGGGAYERHHLLLIQVRENGPTTRIEFFDAEDSAEALARFDALSAEPEPSPPRRVRENIATAHVARLDAASRTRDEDAVASLLSPQARIASHTNGLDVGRRQILDWWRLLFADRDASFRIESLATLGPSLALTRHFWTGSASASAAFEVGPFESEVFAAYEVDPEGRALNVEAYTQLGDAIVKLYERYAELLPAGAARERAVATARSVAVMESMTHASGDAIAAIVAPAVSFEDHRSVVGLPPARGAEEFVRRVAGWYEPVERSTTSTEAILDLCANGMLVREDERGRDRGGAEFERQFLAARVFDEAGRLSRFELFDLDDLEAALARFDALTAEPAPRPLRRVRENAATAHIARLNAASRDRDQDAVTSLLSPEFRVASHINGLDIDRQQALDWWRLLFADPDASFRLESLATLGASLALTRQVWTGSAGGSAAFEVGPFENEVFSAYEVDAEGRALNVEAYGALRGAIVKLYERYAELLPEGAERTREAATARTVAVMESLTQGSVDAVAAVLAPDAAFEDHRTLVGLPPARGANELARRLASWFEPVEHAAATTDDILDLRPNGMLVRATERGRDRAGADFERQYLIARLFDEAGWESRIELFDPERPEEALARFDALAAEGALPAGRRGPRPNAATENSERLGAALRARDVAAATDLFAEGAEVLHHPTGSTWDREGIVAVVREALVGARGEFSYHDEPLASLGSRLALFRSSVSGAGVAFGAMDVGPVEREHLMLVEADADARRRRAEHFAPDRLGYAVARLYERHAELLPEGPARDAATATARLVAVMLHDDGSSPEPFLAPEMEFVDRRRLGIGSARGAQRFMRGYLAGRALENTSPPRVHEIFELREDALLFRSTTSGTDASGGGAFERELIRLWRFAPDGRLAREEWFEPERLDEALARFDALTGAAETGAVRIENAATRALDRCVDAWNARDWQRYGSLLAEGFRYLDRRSTFRLDLDRSGYLEFQGPAFEMGMSRATTQVLATRGTRLALVRATFEGAGRDVGPTLVDSLLVAEADASGEPITYVAFDPDALDAAFAELDAHYAAGEAAGHSPAWGTRGSVRALAATDWEALAATFAPGFVSRDHRPVGVFSLESGADDVAGMRVLSELAPDGVVRTYHVLGLDERRMLTISGTTGMREGGSFETFAVTVEALAPDGRITSLDLYGLDQLDEARARFEAL